MKSIYLIQMQTYTGAARIIRRFTKDKYSHIGISFDKDGDVIYSFGRRKVNNPLNGGFTIEKKDGSFFKKYNKSICKIYEVEVTNRQYRQLKRILNKMEKNKENYKYDFVGIILRYFRIPVTFKNRYVCSYFIAELLDSCDIYKFNKKLSFIRPGDFDDLLGKVIYEGKYLK